MLVYSVHQAKTHLSKILTQLESNNEIIISRYGKPVARLIPYDAPQVKRKFGAMKGIIQVDDAFFDELPEEELSAWEK